MRVRVLFFARLRELIGCEALDMDVPAGATTAEVWRRLQQRFDALAAFSAPPLMAIDEEYAGKDAEVREGSEIALFPPVSGG